MILKARNGMWRRLMKELGIGEYDRNSVIASAAMHGNDQRFSEIDSDALSTEELKILRGYAAGSNVHTEKHLVAKIDTIISLYGQDAVGKPVKKIEHLVDAIRAYMGPMKRRWVYIEEEDGMVCPYFVQSATYHPKERIRHDGPPKWVEVRPQYVTMSVVALERGRSTSRRFRFDIGDLYGGKMTVQELFKARNIAIETPWVGAKYDKEMERYKDVSAQLGHQFSAVGYGHFTKGSGYYSSSQMISMVRDGYNTKVIIDDNEEDEDDERQSSRGRSKSDSTSNSFWRKYDLEAIGKSIRDEEKEDEDEDSDDDNGDEPTKEELQAVDKTVPPVHPYIRCFDLDKHQYLTIHIGYIEDYPWDASLIDKLILPAETKDLIQILVSGTKENKEDIIRGKMQGVIVIATGEPGTGKTLTAEVFSETIQRPLYVVQCAQLGTVAATIEERLTKILRRAQRWQAILLIDEADVYIRARGDDIEQNAIVGVFLRVLEYYRGVMFMTSNRATVIDDAIMSRATAWVRYALPNNPAPEGFTADVSAEIVGNELADVWRVLAANYGVKLTDSDIAILLKKLPKLSGRCVRNLIRLAMLLAAARKEQVTEAMLRQVAQFQYLPHHTDEELREAAE